MEKELRSVIEILRVIKKYVNNRDTNVLMSSFKTNKEVIKCIDDHISRLSNSDISALNELMVLFLPTSDFQEISISNGWGVEYLKLAKEFDNLIQLIKNKM